MNREHAQRVLDHMAQQSPLLVDTLRITKLNGELAFKIRAMEALEKAGMIAAAKLVGRLPTGDAALAKVEG